MPFFLPSRLIDFEYLDNDSEDFQYDKDAALYQKEIEFAFFAVNFGYAKSDYYELTNLEKAFIYKAWENKLVSDTSYMANAVFNGVSNSLRKKGKNPIPLWKKKRKKVDKDIMKSYFESAQKNQDRSWLDKIYKSNGIQLKKKGGGDPCLTVQ